MPFPGRCRCSADAECRTPGRRWLAAEGAGATRPGLRSLSAAEKGSRACPAAPAVASLVLRAPGSVEGRTLDGAAGLTDFEGSARFGAAGPLVALCEAPDSVARPIATHIRPTAITPPPMKAGRVSLARPVIAGPSRLTDKDGRRDRSRDWDSDSKNRVSTVSLGSGARSAVITQGAAEWGTMPPANGNGARM
jgi:hypothetical protein